MQMQEEGVFPFKNISEMNNENKIVQYHKI